MFLKNLSIWLEKGTLQVLMMSVSVFAYMMFTYIDRITTCTNWMLREIPEKSGTCTVCSGK